MSVCVCACTSALICLPSSGSSVCLMLTCTCGERDTLGPHALYTCVRQRWEGRSSPRRLIYGYVCGHLLRAWGCNRPVCSHGRTFTVQLRSTACNAQGKKERKTERKEKIAASGSLRLPLSILPHQLKALFTAPVALSL